MIDHRHVVMIPVMMILVGHREGHHDDFRPTVDLHLAEDGGMMDHVDRQDVSRPIVDLHHVVWTDHGVHRAVEDRLDVVHHQDECHQDVECLLDEDRHHEDHHQDHGDVDHHHLEAQEEDPHQETH